MSLADRWNGANGISAWKVTRDVVLVVVGLVFIDICWPFYSVPVGSRGVVTQFGRIIDKLKTVEAEQKQKVAIAEAEASAVRATADGDAYAKIKNATAEAEALRVQSAAISQNPQVLELRRITVQQTQAERWNGQLPQSIYAGAPIPFINVTSH